MRAVANCWKARVVRSWLPVMVLGSVALGLLIWENGGLSSTVAAQHRYETTVFGHCAQGYRRHTITAKCVRRQAKFPYLSW